jgi:hypothetical protein
LTIGIRMHTDASADILDVWNELYSYPTPLVLHEVPKVEKPFMLMRICRGMKRGKRQKAASLKRVRHQKTVF